MRIVTILQVSRRRLRRGSKGNDVTIVSSAATVRSPAHSVQTIGCVIEGVPKPDTCLQIRPILYGASHTKEENMKNKILTLLLATAMTLSFVGCGTGSNTSSNSAQQTSEAALPTTDRAGNEITVPENVEKIVSMAPSTTEVLIDLGLADKIIACDTYSGNSSFASSLNADIPQFDMMSPDNEAIAALEPDIVFTTGMSQVSGDDVYSALKAAGVCVADIPSSASISDIKEDISFIGSCVGAKDKSDSILAQMDTVINTLSEKAASVSADDQKSVLYVMSVPTPDYPDIYTCGSGTYMDEIFSLVGLKNVAAGAPDTPWINFSEENVISSNPAVIIVGDNYTPDAVEAVKSLSGWENIDAVKNGEVYLIDGDAFNQPNQYVLHSAIEIAKQAYPDVFADIEDPFSK